MKQSRNSFEYNEKFSFETNWILSPAAIPQFLEEAPQFAAVLVETVD